MIRRMLCRTGVDITEEGTMVTVAGVADREDEDIMVAVGLGDVGVVILDGLETRECIVEVVDGFIMLDFRS